MLLPVILTFLSILQLSDIKCFTSSILAFPLSALKKVNSSAYFDLIVILTVKFHKNTVFVVVIHSYLGVLSCPPQCLWWLQPWVDLSCSTTIIFKHILNIFMHADMLLCISKILCFLQFSYYR